MVGSLFLPVPVLGEGACSAHPSPAGVHSPAARLRAASPSLTPCSVRPGRLLLDLSGQGSAMSLWSWSWSPCPLPCLGLILIFLPGGNTTTPPSPPWEVIVTKFAYGPQSSLTLSLYSADGPGSGKTEIHLPLADNLAYDLQGLGVIYLFFLLSNNDDDIVYSCSN